MSKNANKKSPKSPKTFVCENCDYICYKSSEFSKHKTTAKHLNANDANKKSPICICGKSFKHHSSLSRHKLKCVFLDEVVSERERESENSIIPTKEETGGDNQLIQLLIKENFDFKNIILDVMKTNTDLQKQMIEVCSKNNATTITNNSHNNNKTFNLQFFLNEQCKDAMNLMDFVKSVSLQLSDLENVTRLGYVDGISGIIMKKLNEMDIHKRPIHCSDAKREILYVREDGIWEKESDDHSKLRKAIKGISKKNRILLSEWSESHPDSNDIHSPMNLEYMLMIVQAMGGKGELVDNENKIMRKIMKNVLIDKV